MWVRTSTELPSKMFAADLSESAALAHFCAIAWLSAAEKTDCLIPKRGLGAVLPLNNDPLSAAEECVAAGYWRVHTDRYFELIDHAGTLRQSLVAVDKKRQKDREAYERKRDKEADSASGLDSGSDSEPDSGSDDSLPTNLLTNHPSRGEAEEPQDEDLDDYFAQLNAEGSDGHTLRSIA